MSDTRSCMVCPELVDLGQLHRAVLWNTEVKRGAEIHVHQSEVTGWMHLDCAARLGTGQAAPDRPAEVTIG